MVKMSIPKTLTYVLAFTRQELAGRRLQAVTRAVKAVSVATEDAYKAEAKANQQSSSNEWVPLWVPQQETKIASC